MHNLTLTDMNVLDPNVKLGDLQLMALESWMTHEEARAKEVKKVMKKQAKESLYIKAEKISPMVVISNHSIISNDAKPTPRYLATQEKAISHFEDTLSLLGTESQRTCQRRWISFPHSL